MTRQRFEFLDALRGLAALAIVALHAGLGFNLEFYPEHGYLAVDFFFCLSGFVLAYAYDDRLAAGLSFPSFAAARLTRLYPMLFAAAIFALVALPAAPPLFHAANFTLLPLGLLCRQQAYPLNGPLWSLFFEFFASFLFFFDPTRPARPIALSLTLLFCFGSALALTILHAGAAQAIGFASPISFLAGIPRVMFSFTAGVLLHRFVPLQNLPRLPAWLLALIMLAVFCVPSGPADSAFDIATIFCLFPLLVALGAKIPDHGRPLWKFAGQLSYPLYVIHEPVLACIHRLALPKAFAAICGITAAITLAYVLLTLYDAPLRAWLSKQRFFEKKRAKNFCEF